MNKRDSKTILSSLSTDVSLRKIAGLTTKQAKENWTKHQAKIEDKLKQFSEPAAGGGMTEEAIQKALKEAGVDKDFSELLSRKQWQKAFEYLFKKDKSGYQAVMLAYENDEGKAQKALAALKIGSP